MRSVVERRPYLLETRGDSVKYWLAGSLFAIALTGCESPVSGSPFQNSDNSNVEGTAGEPDSAAILGSNVDAASQAQLDAGTDTGSEAQGGAESDAASGAVPDAQTGQAEPQGQGIPCDVASILEARCARCHGREPLFGAPSSLDTLAAFQKPATRAPQGPLHQAAAARISPGATSPMPPPSQPQLTAEERATLSAWLSAGAPAAAEGCAVETKGPDEAGAPAQYDDLECFQLLAHAPGDMQARFPVGVSPDNYVSFFFAAPWRNRTGYAVVIRPVVDNAKVLHHWLLFEQHESTVADGAVVDSDGLHPGGDMLNGWAPGGGLLDFRATGEDVGFEFPSDTLFSLEIHYNSDDPTAQDASGAEICIQKDKPKNLVGISWLGADLFGTLGAPPVTSVESLCRPISREPIHIVRVSPHMHLQGKHATAIIQRASGETEVLHDAPFDFADQAFYPRDKTLYPGDTITTRCDYHRPVSFGARTNDEMCYLFVLAYPRGALTDGGLIGTLGHGGGACLGY